MDKYYYNNIKYKCINYLYTEKYSDGELKGTLCSPNKWSFNYNLEKFRCWFNKREFKVDKFVLFVPDEIHHHNFDGTITIIDQRELLKKYMK